MSWERFIEEQQQLKDQRAAAKVIEKPLSTPDRIEGRNYLEELFTNIDGVIKEDLGSIGKLQWGQEPIVRSAITNMDRKDKVRWVAYDSRSVMPVVEGQEVELFVVTMTQYGQKAVNDFYFEIGIPSDGIRFIHHELDLNVSRPKDKEPQKGSWSEDWIIRGDPHSRSGHSKGGEPYSRFVHFDRDQIGNEGDIVEVRRLVRPLLQEYYESGPLKAKFDRSFTEYSYRPSWNNSYYNRNG